MANFELLQESVSDYLFEEACSYVSEGTTLEINAIFKKLCEEYKPTIKDIKKDLKDKNYTKAAKGCDDLLKVIKEMEEEIDNIKDDAMSVIGGYFFQGWMSFLKAFIAAMITLPIGGYGATITELKDLLDIVSGVVREWNSKKEITLEMFNARRAKIKGIIREMENAVKNLKKDIEREGKNSEKEEDKEVKESAEIKLAIYESCHAGEITEAERDELLAML